MAQDIPGFPVRRRAFSRMFGRAIERDPETARAAALRLVTFLTPRATPEYTRSRGGLAPWQMRKIDRHLRENLEQSLSLCELADLVSLSVSHFCRAFKDSFGSTPHRYIIRLRLELAQRLMLNTEDPLSQIAIASGHADQAHLCKLFRRGMGETPGAWRRRNFTAAQCRGGGPCVRGALAAPASSRRRPCLKACAGFNTSSPFFQLQWAVDSHRLESVEAEAERLVRVAADIEAVDRHMLNSAVRIDDEGGAQCDAFDRVEGCPARSTVRAFTSRSSFGKRQVLQVFMMGAPRMMDELIVGRDTEYLRIAIFEFAVQLAETPRSRSGRRR